MASLYAIPAPPPARLTTMPRPRGGGWLDEEMAKLRAAGVDVLVCLLTEGERAELSLLDEPHAAARAGLDFHEFPIIDFGTPDHAEVRPLLDELAAQMASGRHVAVHCHAGVGRSSLVAAALLVRLGAPTSGVWDTISEARGLDVPQTEAHRRWLYEHQLLRVA